MHSHFKDTLEYLASRSHLKCFLCLYITWDTYSPSSGVTVSYRFILISFQTNIKTKQKRNQYNIKLQIVYKHQQNKQKETNKKNIKYVCGSTKKNNNNNITATSLTIL
jgi:hypothetical protein